MLKLLNYKNPKITEKNISFRNWVLLQKNYFKISIYFGKESPFFKVDKEFNSQYIKIEGGLIIHPICEQTKFGFFKNYFSHESNRIELNVSTKADINLKSYNKLYNTNYTFTNNERNQIYGFFKLIKESKGFDFFYGNFISINNSYENYINSLNEYLLHKDKPYIVNLVIQKINEWESWPVISMNFNSDYSEIIKDKYFDGAINNFEMPLGSDILYKK